MKALKLIILTTIILIIGCGCTLNKFENITDNINIEENIKDSNTYLLDEYYPLAAGMYFEPMYLPDCANYSEKVVYKDGNIFVVFITYGGKSADIVFLEKDDLLVYEIYRLVADEEIEERKIEYQEIINMFVENNEDSALEEKFKKIIDQTDKKEKKIYLIHPSLGVTKWDGGEILKYEFEELLWDIPSNIKRDYIFPAENIIIVKRGNDYYFYYKGEGIIIYFNIVIKKSPSSLGGR